MARVRIFDRLDARNCEYALLTPGQWCIGGSSATTRVQGKLWKERKKERKIEDNVDSTRQSIKKRKT